ncbi:hypothetical protein GDO78_021367 [Eleutherodactylus coqui]|uniref:Uncharacterized protein n=1 Tax=Eleutherodactylus coqui TaxID=57060 RepID=A0A8J6E5D3_ELECQ|nr:hypothetical protein GDO78_021367 [Eleutherodactylus coqui]
MQNISHILNMKMASPLYEFSDGQQDLIYDKTISHILNMNISSLLCELFDILPFCDFHSYQLVMNQKMGLV